MEANANTDPGIRCEKVLVPPDLSFKEIMGKFEFSKTTAFNAKKRGWFIKNYSRNQIIIDRNHFNLELCYSIAKQVFWKRFRNNPVAMSIRDDLLQEGVYLQFIQSGKIKAGANERYNERYGFWWAAYNGMMAYLTKWINATQYDVELQDEVHPMMHNGNRRWSPDYGWSYC